MSLDELVGLCADWQQRLRLQDWNVEIAVKRKLDATRDDCMAYIEVMEDKKHARITFIDPVDLDPEGWPQETLERSLVHELLHLHVWPFNPKENTPRWTAMEQAVHALAGALVDMKPQNRASTGGTELGAEAHEAALVLPEDGDEGVVE